MVVSSSCFAQEPATTGISDMKASFLHPPLRAKPGVYWYFMDGNLSARSMTEDLESMKKAGIGNVLFLEVNVGVPRGPENLLSEHWKELFAHAVRECERLGIELTMGIGPGWTGSGGPWVPLSQSMQHLVSSTAEVSEGQQQIVLDVPPPRKPFFGEGGLTPALRKQWLDFYEDVAVLAFPTPKGKGKIAGIDEKALYYRAPFSSMAGVKPYLPPFTAAADSLKDAAIRKDQIIDLTGKLGADGTLHWKVPPGHWTIMRFGRRNNGAITRPAPVPGLGFEADKFDTAAIDAHLNKYIGQLLEKTGRHDPNKPGGWTMLHMDSWEMGSQNWSARFRQEFRKRRGYDPLPFFPVYAGNVVGSEELSERFLWDLRQTSQELMLAYHAQEVKKYAKRNGMNLSIEPYDMNPNADLELGSVADVPMCEFWSQQFGFNTTFSVIEATSIAHVKGIPLVPAEAFTAEAAESWKQHPASMKNQGDWAFAAGINRFVFHTFQNQYLADSLRPGMTMGPYGVHWDRGQTWWPMAEGYHRYISSCSYLLQQGKTVADVLYLTPEGSPHIFRPPSSALIGDTLGDRRGYNFDGCAPGMLLAATVKNGRIVFPGGGSYRLLVLPVYPAMTPALLQKIRSLISDGATVVGGPPTRAEGLSGYPKSDGQVQSIAREIWGSLNWPQQHTARVYGKGRIFWGGDLNSRVSNLYPDYELTASLLAQMGVTEDFSSDGPIRYTHRAAAGWDLYFVSNRSDAAVRTTAAFRSIKGRPQLWDPMTGEIRALPEFTARSPITQVPLEFEPYQSFFVIFAPEASSPGEQQKNFMPLTSLTTLTGSWDLHFDPKWGGPAQVSFDKLEDWSRNSNDGIRYYSGIATYRQRFDLPSAASGKLFLDLGDVKNMARVKLNGKDLGVVWTFPWRVEISGVVRAKDNELEIEVANLWANRLIGDEKLPDDGIHNNQWPEWLSKGLPRTSGRYTFATFKHYSAGSPLLPSGLLGPVTIRQQQ